MLCINLSFPCQLKQTAPRKDSLWVGASGDAMAVAGCRRCLDADTQGTRRNALVEQQVQQRARGS
jgi:hypothetical protein